MSLKCRFAYVQISGITHMKWNSCPGQLSVHSRQTRALLTLKFRLLRYEDVWFICKVQSVTTVPLFFSRLIEIRINCWAFIFGNSPITEFESLGYKLQYRTTMAQDIHSVSSMVSGPSLKWTLEHTHHFHASVFCFINGNLWPVIQLETALIGEVFQTLSIARFFSQIGTWDVRMA